MLRLLASVPACETEQVEAAPTGDLSTLPEVLFVRRALAFVGLHGALPELDMVLDEEIAKAGFGGLQCSVDLPEGSLSVVNEALWYMHSQYPEAQWEHAMASSLMCRLNSSPDSCCPEDLAY